MARRVYGEWGPTDGFMVQFDAQVSFNRDDSLFFFLLVVKISIDCDMCGSCSEGRYIKESARIRAYFIKSNTRFLKILQKYKSYITKLQPEQISIRL